MASAQGQQHKADSQWTERSIKIGRNAKVVKGGRIFRFGVLTAVGDARGQVGVGRGKAHEVPEAIRKGNESAKRNLIQVALDGHTIPHVIVAYHGATKVIMMPASKGTGVIAGGAMRAILELAGIQDVLAKCYGSTNPVNVALATIKGLKQAKSAQMIANKRGKTVEEILGDNHGKG